MSPRGLRNQVTKLMDDGPHCPACGNPPVALRVNLDGAAPAPPEPCPACGRLPELLIVEELVVVEANPAWPPGHAETAESGGGTPCPTPDSD